MKYAVIDTESSGLFNFAKPADAEGQPRLASLAIITLDEALHALDEFYYLVKPEGWTMQPEATAVNGLTTDYLAYNGQPVRAALDIYSQVIADGFVIVAFNAQFDLKVMRGELRRAGLPDLFAETPNLCVMRAATPVCRIPHAKGTGYKFPKLAEACAHFRIDQADMHTALGDARAAADIFRELRKLQMLPDPAVHFAKTPPTIKPTTP